MFNKNNIKLLGKIIVMIVILFTFTISSIAVNNGTIVLKFAHTDNVYDTTQLGAEVFKKLVEERSNNQIKVEIYPATLSSSEDELHEFMMSGTLEVMNLSLGHVAGYFPDAQFLQLPFLFNNHEHYIVSRNSRVVKDLLERFGDKMNLIVLGIVSDTNGLAISSTKPVYSIEDCNGLKLRCMQNPLFIDMYRAFGCTPTPTDWGELYTSLQTGLVEAHDIGVKSSYDYKLSEVANCFAITEHMWAQRIIAISKEAWNRLSDEQKEIISISGKEACEISDQFVYVKEEEFIEKAKEDGYVVTYPDIKPFKEKSSLVYDKWFEKNPHWKELYEEIQYLDPHVREPVAGTEVK